MAHQALYRKYRPLNFDDVVEQAHVVNTLRNIVLSGKIAHAYLFSGTRGTGKTTMAKIFARAANCLQPINGNPCNTCTVCHGILDGTVLDVIEIDAASNNSVDNVRGIIDEVGYTPTQARIKVYIIDEVHMLSTGAFNALLKTLRNPEACHVHTGDNRAAQASRDGTVQMPAFRFQAYICRRHCTKINENSGRSRS